MRSFDYKNIDSEKNISEALTDSSRYLAGGTTLVDLMKLHVELPDTVLGIQGLPYKNISEDHENVHVGALVSNTDMAHNKIITKNFPFLSEAILSGASVQLRNRATTAGNILQRTRCSYFRDTATACNKRQPGSGCAAIPGHNRMHAILGTSDQCIATHPSDMCVALMALDTTVKTTSRELPFASFYTLPGSTPSVENVLSKGELITGISIKKNTVFKNSAYVKIRDRASYAFALTSAAVAIQIQNGKVQDVRLAMGGVGTLPWRNPEAEAVLKGNALNLEKIEQAAKTFFANAKAQSHNNFKIELGQQTLIRALKQVGNIA